MEDAEYRNCGFESGDCVNRRPHQWAVKREMKRIEELDGVRGLAIAMVLTYHFSAYPLYRGPGEIFLRTLSGITFGWAGVDLFFVLSGFLITGILLETKGLPGFFRTF